MSRTHKNEFVESEYKTANRLAEALGRSCELERDQRGLVFVVRNWDSGVSFGDLMKACAALQCAPDDLFFNADTRNEGYCETCYSTYPVLEFWAKAR